MSLIVVAPATTPAANGLYGIHPETQF